jgi:hypothetical protein
LSRVPSEGITSENALLRRFKNCKFEALAKEAGIGPSNWFPSRVKVVMLERVLPMSAGSLPTSWLAPRPRNVREEML